MASKKYIEITPEREEIKVIKYSNQSRIPRAVIDFSLSNDVLQGNNDKSRLVFVCRLKLEEDRYYPMHIEGDNRYIYSSFPTQERHTQTSRGLASVLDNKNTDFPSATQIDTLNNLLNLK